jgi:hypothetical protein
MIGWAAIVVAIRVDPWLGVATGVLLLAVWSWRLRVRAKAGQSWSQTLLPALAWAAWGLAAWIGIFFLLYIVYFAGAYFDWWEIHDE